MADEMLSVRTLLEAADEYFRILNHVDASIPAPHVGWPYKGFGHSDAFHKTHGVQPRLPKGSPQFWRLAEELDTRGRFVNQGVMREFQAKCQGLKAQQLEIMDRVARHLRESTAALKCAVGYRIALTHDHEDAEILWLELRTHLQFLLESSLFSGASHQNAPIDRIQVLDLNALQPKTFDPETVDVVYDVIQGSDGKALLELEARQNGMPLAIVHLDLSTKAAQLLVNLCIAPRWCITSKTLLQELLPDDWLRLQQRQNENERNDSTELTANELRNMKARMRQLVENTRKKLLRSGFPVLLAPLQDLNTDTLLSAKVRLQVRSCKDRQSIREDSQSLRTLELRNR